MPDGVIKIVVRRGNCYRVMDANSGRYLTECKPSSAKALQAAEDPTDPTSNPTPNHSNKITTDTPPPPPPPNGLPPPNVSGTGGLGTVGW